MEKSIVKHLGTYRMEGTYEASGQKLFTDASKPAGGLGEYATPVDILGQSLAACAMTTMAIRASKENIDLTDSYAVVGEIVEDLTTITVTKISIEFHIKGVEESLRKKLETFAHKGCFVGNSLNCEKNFTFVWE